MGRLGQHRVSASSSSHLEGRLHSGDLEQAEFGQSGRLLLLLFPNRGVAGRYHGAGVPMGVRVVCVEKHAEFIVTHSFDSFSPCV
jgi:hypothetical protein